ncbi:hypothetical protein BH11PSE8_BH11PSE8_44350 [soil metagenome]
MASGLGVTTSQGDCTVLEKTLVLGRNQVTEDSRAYAFSRAVDAGNLEYASGESRFALSLLWGGGTPFAGRCNNNDEKSIGTDGTGHVGVKTWANFFGPLTDRANAPTEVDVQYTGTIVIHSRAVRIQPDPWRGLRAGRGWYCHRRQQPARHVQPRRDPAVTTGRGQYDRL